MKIDNRFCATASILFISLLSSCDKKDESTSAQPPAPEKSQTQPTTAPKPESPPETAKSADKPAPPAQAKTPAPVAGSEKTLAGTIAGQPVIMTLSFVEEGGAGRATVTGSYYLESQGTGNAVKVSGTFKEGNLTMKQSVGGNVTGAFDLNNDPANKSLFLGSWTSQGKVMPVKLNATTE